MAYYSMKIKNFFYSSFTKLWKCKNIFNICIGGFVAFIQILLSCQWIKHEKIIQVELFNVNAIE